MAQPHHCPFTTLSPTVGITNIGNTCFMNSSVQALSAVEPLAAYFLGGRHVKDINKTNPLGKGGAAAVEFASTLKKLWCDKHAVNGTTIMRLKSVTATSSYGAHIFRGFAQEDAQEWLNQLIDTLHEDLNLVKNKLYAEEKVRAC